MQTSTGADPTTAHSLHHLPPGSSAPAARLLLLEVAAAAASSTKDRALMQHVVMEEAMDTAARLPASDIKGAGQQIDVVQVHA